MLGIVSPPVAEEEIDHVQTEVPSLNYLVSS